MRLFLIAFSSLIFLTSSAQFVENSTVDFGKITEWDNPMAEFVFVNNTGSEIVFLPIGYDRHTKVYLEKKKLQPGESCLIWVQYYTEKGGKFSIDVPIYVNIQGEPIVLNVQGNIRSFSPEAQSVCPVMDGPNPIITSQADHKLEVRDAESGEIISAFDIEVVNHSGSYDAFESDGVHEIRNFKPDLYDISVESPGYYNHNQVIYLNALSSTTVIYLKRDNEAEEWNAAEEEVIVEEDLNYSEPQDTVVQVIEETELVIEEVEDTISEASNEPTSDFVDGELNDSKYKFNNLVFLIDVSGSMARNEKLALLKYSMYRMIDVLRPEDKVSIVTYSSEVNVLLKGVSGANKDQLKEMIFNLEAKGQSFGSEGVDRAYEIALEEFIEGGNNEIILASDGKINSIGFSENKLFRKVRRNYRRHGILFSSIGFGTNSPSLVFMEEMSVNGHGAFLRIGDQQMAEQALIENIMIHSAKEPQTNWFEEE